MARDIGRMLWMGRAWTAAPVLLPWGVVILWEPLAAPGLMVALGVEIGCAVAVARQVAALRAGDVGELLYVTGQRVPLRIVKTLRTWERLEVAVGALGVLALLATSRLDTLPVNVAVGVVCTLFLGVLTRARRTGWVTQRALEALMDGDLDQAARALAPLRRRATTRAATAPLHASVLARQGHSAEARRAWTAAFLGQLDGNAVPLALAELGEGTTKLAEKWLAVERPGDRYQRYLRALVAGHLALHQSDPDTAIAEASAVVDQLPDWYRRELDLLVGAALQLRGDTPSAQAQLASIGGIEDDRWRAAGQPRLWRLLEDAAAGVATNGLPTPASPPPAVAGEAPTDDVFAPPRERNPTRWRTRQVGALPAEGVVMAAGRSRLTSAVLLLLSALLLLLGSLIGVLGTVLLLAGDLDPSEATLFGAVVLLAAIVVTHVLVSELARYRLRRPGPGVRLSDGALLNASPLWIWQLWGIQPLLLAGILLVAGPPALEYGARGSLWSVGLSLAMAALFGVALVKRLRLMSLIRGVHFDDPGATADRALQVLPDSAWTILALIVAGRPDEAEATARASAPTSAPAAALLPWFEAARGEVDLDRMLSQHPDGDGPVFRHEITLRLAALAQGRPERIRARLQGPSEVADRLPSRFGGMLRRLDLAVLTGCDPTAAEAYRAEHAAALVQGAWVETCWPTLVPA